MGFWEALLLSTELDDSLGEELGKGVFWGFLVLAIAFVGWHYAGWWGVLIAFESIVLVLTTIIFTTLIMSWTLDESAHNPRYQG